jgi:hypothetical protein
MLTRRGFRGFCVVRALRNYRVHCHRSGSPRCAGGDHARRHAKDLVANRRSGAGLYDDPRGSDHRRGGAGRAPHASGNRIRLCVGGRLRASHPRSSHPHDPTRRWLPNPAGHAPCGWQARERQEQNSHHVCGGEGKAHRLSSLRAHPARGRLLGAMRLM